MTTPPATVHAGALDDAFIGRLRDIVGAAHLWCAPLARVFDPGFDAANLDADAAVAPADSAEVSAVLALCNERRVPVVPQGGRSGLAQAAVSGAGELLLLTHRMNRILEVDALAGVAVVEAGVTLEVLQQRLAADGLSLGVDLAARGSATLGGMLATNAGGIEAFRNGVMRHRVLGLEAVLADGRVYRDLKRVAKANEGYDIRQLFIGAEGTLGVVTRVVLKLEPALPAQATALLACDDAAHAVAVYARLRRHAGEALRAVEIMWREYALTSCRETGETALLDFIERAGEVFVIIDLAAAPEVAETLLGDLLAPAIEAGELSDAVIARNGRERAAIWRVREDSWSIDRVHPGGLWFDISLPIGALDDSLAAIRQRVASVDPKLRVFAMGHLGDGNLHLTITSGEATAHHHEAVSEAVFAGLAASGGSFSAEHGIGLEKRAALRRHVSPVKQALMRAIKTAFDPNGIMNPGKVL